MVDQQASSVVEPFKDGWIYKHGVPYILLPDQRKSVDGSEIREMCREFGIEKRHSSPYPGEAERII